MKLKMISDKIQEMSDKTIIHILLNQYSDEKDELVRSYILDIALKDTVRIDMLDIIQDKLIEDTIKLKDPKNFKDFNSLMKNIKNYYNIIDKI